MEPQSSTPRLELIGISKQYPAVKANDQVSLRVAPGQIHAVLGENGAGKSTMMKMIYGAVQPDEGEIRWNGQAVKVASPRAGAAPGHQHGLPALLAVRHADRRRERLARAGQDPQPGRGEPAHREGGARVRPGRRPGAAGAHAVGRRAPARGDRARAAHQPEAADPRRADLGADAAGGGQAVRHAAQAVERGLLDPVHQPQARRDPRAVPPLHGAARRQGHRRGRPDAGDQRQPVAADDRRRAAAAAAPRAQARRAWCSRSRA